MCLCLENDDSERKHIYEDAECECIVGGQCRYGNESLYVTEDPFMHLTVCCRFLICCVTQVFWAGGVGGTGW